VEKFPKKKMDKNNTVEMSPEELIELEFMRNNVFRKSTFTSRYAVKMAKKSAINEYTNRYISNMVKNEIKILRRINNPPEYNKNEGNCSLFET